MTGRGFIFFPQTILPTLLGSLQIYWALTVFMKNMRVFSQLDFPGKGLWVAWLCAVVCNFMVALTSKQKDASFEPLFFFPSSSFVFVLKAYFSVRVNSLNHHPWLEYVFFFFIILIVVNSVVFPLELKLLTRLYWDFFSVFQAVCLTPLRYQHWISLFYPLEMKI